MLPPNRIRFSVVALLALMAFLLVPSPPKEAAAIGKWRGSEYYPAQMHGVIGDLSNVVIVRKFGRNPAIPTSWEPIWGVSSPVLPTLTTAKTIRVKAGGNANDSAAGTGAQQIHVIGLDANFDPIEEDIETNGTSASASTAQEFIRVHRIFVNRVGTYGGANDIPGRADFWWECMSVSGTTKASASFEFWMIRD